MNVIFGKYLLIYTFSHIVGSFIKYMFGTDERKEKFWNNYTRCVSLINALNCVVAIYQYVIPNMRSYASLLAIGDDEFVNDLFRFSAYLFVDGLFVIPTIINKRDTDTITSIIHHFVGGLGIFIIASQRQGLGMGVYFSATEISTPLLYVSWILYTNKINGLFTIIVFGTFYLVFFISRILTIPLLSYYLWINSNTIATLPLFHWSMVYFGCGILMTLNILWFVMLTIKIGNLLRYPLENNSLKNKQK